METVISSIQRLLTSQTPHGAAASSVDSTPPCVGFWVPAGAVPEARGDATEMGDNIGKLTRPMKSTRRLPP